MKNLINELHELTPDELPGIENVKISEGQLRRISARTHRNIERINQKKSVRSAFCLRRALSIIAAAAMIMGMSTAVFAYRDKIYSGIVETGRTIKEFFTREEEVIDPKAEIINSTDKESGIVLEVKKAVRDGDQTYLYVSLTNSDAPFSGDILTCEQYTLYKNQSRFDKTPAVTPENGYGVVTQRILGMNGVYAGEIFAFLREKPTDCVEMIIPVIITGEGRYRFTIDHLITVSEEVDANGYTGNLLREIIAEELTVDFTIEGDLESLDRTVIECGSEFSVSGVTLHLDSITVSPLEIIVDIRDLLTQSIDVDGWKTEALDCLHHYSDLYDIIRSDPSLSEEESKEIYNRIRPKDYYEVKIEFTDDTLQIDRMNSYASFGYAWDKSLHRHTFRTETPVFPHEIAQIRLENINNPEDIIVIWEKQNIE